MHFLAVVAALVAAAAAAPTQECCTLLAKQFPNDVHYPDATTYAFEEKAYFSLTCVLDPGCYFTPNDKSEVATAVKLFASNNCRFSVRAGGHSTIKGAANNDGGVTIAMSKFLQRDVDVEKNIMHVGPGNRFYQLYNEADKYAKVPVVGRYGQVGTGLLLGAGLSYLNLPYGLSIDNVAAYEVVLADGRIVTANRTSYPDLFRALKGGGDNFGVVTRYDLELYDRPETITGGMIHYGEEAMDQLDDLAFQYNTVSSISALDTHVLPQWGYNGATKQREAFVPFYYAGQTSGGLPDSLKDWENPPHSKSTVRNSTSLEALAHENNDGFPNGQAQAMRTFTIYPDLDLYKEFSERFYQWGLQWKDIPGFYTVNSKQPITPHMVAEGVKKGRNVLGFEGITEPLSVMYFSATTNTVEDAEVVFASHSAFVEEMIELARSRGKLHRYIMWNYSGEEQKSIASYGPANVAFLKRTARKYDPTGVFQRLVGGQKLP